MRKKNQGAERKQNTQILPLNHVDLAMRDDNLWLKQQEETRKHYPLDYIKGKIPSDQGRPDQNFNLVYLALQYHDTKRVR